MIIIAVSGFHSGSLYGTFYGYDTKGNACGFDNTKLHENRPDLTDKQYRFCFNYENFAGSILGTVDDDRSVCICTEKCPNVNIVNNKDGIKEFINFEKKENVGLCSYFKGADYKKSSRSSYSKTGPCPRMGDGNILTETTPFLHRCVPLDQAQALMVVGKMFANQDYIQKSVLSVYQTKKPIGIALCIAILGSFAILVMMRFLAGIVAWILTIGLCFLSFGLSIGLWVLKFQPGLLNQIVETVRNGTETLMNSQNSPKSQFEFVEIPAGLLADIKIDDTFILISAITTSVFTVLLITFVCCMRERTKISVDLIKQASKVFSSVPLLFFTPLLVLTVLVGFWASWCFVFISIITAEENPNVNSSSNFFHSNLISGANLNSNPSFLYNFIKYSKFYHLFGVFWITEFILACQYLVIAGTTVKWYFRRLERKRKNESTSCCADICEFPLFSSISRVMIYHLGTAAFGSFVLTLVQIPRAILLYVQKKLRDANQDNGFVKFLMCCMQCFLAWVEKCLRYLTMNAYIMTMVNSDGFCVSAGDALELLSSNPLQVQSIEMITWSLLFLGRLLVATSSSAYVALSIFRTDNEFKKNALQNVDQVIIYKFVPIIVTFVAAYFISKVFFGLFDMVVKTLVLSYCWDCKMTNGYDEEHFMDKDMMLTMQKSNASIQRRYRRDDDDDVYDDYNRGREMSLYPKL